MRFRVSPFLYKGVLVKSLRTRSHRVCANVLKRPKRKHFNIYFGSIYFVIVFEYNSDGLALTSAGNWQTETD